MIIPVIIWNIVEGIFALIGLAVVACGVACALLDNGIGLGPKESGDNVVK